MKFTGSPVAPAPAPSAASRSRTSSSVFMPSGCPTWSLSASVFSEVSPTRLPASFDARRRFALRRSIRASADQDHCRTFTTAETANSATRAARTLRDANPPAAFADRPRPRRVARRREKNAPPIARVSRPKICAALEKKLTTTSGDGIAIAGALAPSSMATMATPGTGRARHAAMAALPIDPMRRSPGRPPAARGSDVDERFSKARRFRLYVLVPACLIPGVLCVHFFAHFLFYLVLHNYLRI